MKSSESRYILPNLIAGINDKMERGGGGGRAFEFFGNFSVKFPILGTEERFKCDQMPPTGQKKKLI